MNVDEISEINPEALICDGFNEAIIGVGERCGSTPIVAYNIEKILEIMIDRDGMTYEEALEFFDFNILGAYVGENTPIFIRTNL